MQLFSEGRDKPPAMPAEQYNDCISTAVDALSIAEDARPVEDVDWEIRASGKVALSLVLRPIQTSQVLDRLQCDLGFDLATLDWGRRSFSGRPPVTVIEVTLLASP